MRCTQCNIEDVSVYGGFCTPCWEEAKKHILAKYLCSVCGEALNRKLERTCGCGDGCI